MVPKNGAFMVILRDFMGLHGLNGDFMGNDGDMLGIYATN
jgi:hypothetical protein